MTTCFYLAQGKLCYTELLSPHIMLPLTQTQALLVNCTLLHYVEVESYLGSQFENVQFALSGHRPGPGWCLMSAVRIFCEPEPSVWSLAAESCSVECPGLSGSMNGAVEEHWTLREQRTVSPSWKTEITLYFLPLMHYPPSMS